MLWLALPLIESFIAEFDFAFKYLFGLQKTDGHMRLEFKESYTVAEMSLGATDRGHFYPKLESLFVDFSQSELYMDDHLALEFYYRQFYRVGKHLTMAAINNFGKFIFNK